MIINGIKSAASKFASYLPEVVAVGSTFYIQRMIQIADSTSPAVRECIHSLALTDSEWSEDLEKIADNLSCAKSLDREEVLAYMRVAVFALYYLEPVRIIRKLSTSWVLIKYGLKGIRACFCSKKENSPAQKVSSMVEPTLVPRQIKVRRHQNDKDSEPSIADSAHSTRNPSPQSVSYMGESSDALQEEWKKRRQRVIKGKI